MAVSSWCKKHRGQQPDCDRCPGPGPSWNRDHLHLQVPRKEGERRMSDITTRIGALLSKAEGTTNDIERDTYIAKAQELATKYAIDMEAARLAAGGEARRETPVAERVELFDRYDRSQTRSFFVSLYMAIGKANNLRFLIDRESRYVVAHGFQSDIDITTQMYNSLSLQMVSASERYIKTGDWKDRSGFFDRQGEWRLMTARTARRSFYWASPTPSESVASKRNAT